MPRSSQSRRDLRTANQQGRVGSQLRGASEVRRLLRRLPASAKAEMADALEDIAPEFLSAVKADTPVAAAPHRKGRQPGALRGAITAKVLRASLKLRVGLLGKKALSDFFYGRIVELGRKAGSKITKRDRGRRPYRIRWSALPARHFVYAPRADLRNRLRNRLSNFWEHALAEAGAGSGTP